MSRPTSTTRFRRHGVLRAGTLALCKEKTMAATEIEAVAHCWHLEVVQAGKLGVADAILTPDVVVHANGQEVRGRRWLTALYWLLRICVLDKVATKGVTRIMNHAFLLL